MQVRGLDRQTAEAGGRSVGMRSSAGPATVEALLALADGSVWHGLTARSASGAIGAVSVVGELALVGVEGLLSDLPMASFRAHLAVARSEGSGPGLRGCLTAPGATTRLHAAVALAAARGEIGRP